MREKTDGKSGREDDVGWTVSFLRPSACPGAHRVEVLAPRTSKRDCKWTLGL